MIKNTQELLQVAKTGERAIIAVAAAHDADVLKAVGEARRLGIADPILVGKAEKIKELLLSLGDSPEHYTIFDEDSDKGAAAKAVQLVKSGKAGFLMKGLLATADLMRAVIDKENGLRGSRLISHVMMYDVPSYGKPLFITDGGMNTFPDLEKKADILENAAIVAKAVGYDKVHAAAICGAEEVNPKIQSTVDAKALSEMGARWQKYNMEVGGPMGIDLAISKSSCQHKNYKGAVAGNADIILVPTYEVGNALGKSLMYFASAKAAGIIVGATAPIVLVSRADSAETKLQSIALGCVVARNGKF